MPETETCAHCGKDLNPSRIVWLEHNHHHGTWHKEGEVPEAESQGCFTFGAACARKVLKGARPKNW